MTKRSFWMATGIAAATVAVIVVCIVVAVMLVSPRSSGVDPEIAPGGGSASSGGTSGTGIYDYTAAPDHIGERASVKGTVYRVMTAKSGVTFLDFCQGFSDCPFSAVIFKSDLAKFPDVSRYERAVTVSGVIKSYQGKAEMILSGPEQIK